MRNINRKKETFFVLFASLIVSFLIVIFVIKFVQDYQMKEKEKQYFSQLAVPLNASPKDFGNNLQEITNHSHYFINMYYPKVEHTGFNRAIHKKLDEIKASFVLRAEKLNSNDYKDRPILQVDYVTLKSSNSNHAVVFQVRETNLTLNNTIRKQVILNYDLKSNKEIDVIESYVKKDGLNQVVKSLLESSKKQVNSKNKYETIKYILSDLDISNYITTKEDNMIFYLVPYTLDETQHESFKVAVKFDDLSDVLKVQYSNHQYTKIDVVNKPIKDHPTESKPPKVVKDKYIALTFDDGPYNAVEFKIMDYLKSQGVNATFFVVGNRIAANKQSIIKMHKLGFEIGNHTWSHPDLTKISSSLLKEEIDKTNQAITQVTGTPVKLIRPTYGKTNEQVRKQLNLAMINWNIDSLDWKLKNPKQIYSQVINTIKPGGILLMHSIYDSTYESLKLIIPTLKQQGYKIVSVSELYEIYGVKPKYHEINFSPKSR